MHGFYIQIYLQKNCLNIYLCLDDSIHSKKEKNLIIISNFFFSIYILWIKKKILYLEETFFKLFSELMEI